MSKLIAGPTSSLLPTGLPHNSVAGSSPMAHSSLWHGVLTALWSTDDTSAPTHNHQGQRVLGLRAHSHPWIIARLGERDIWGTVMCGKRTTFQNKATSLTEGLESLVSHSRILGGTQTTPGRARQSKTFSTPSSNLPVRFHTQLFGNTCRSHPKRGISAPSGSSPPSPPPYTCSSNRAVQELSEGAGPSQRTEAYQSVFTSSNFQSHLFTSPKPAKMCTKKNILCLSLSFNQKENLILLKFRNQREKKMTRQKQFLPSPPPIKGGGGGVITFQKQVAGVHGSSRPSPSKSSY